MLAYAQQMSGMKLLAMLSKEAANNCSRRLPESFVHCPFWARAERATLVVHDPSAAIAAFRSHPVDRAPLRHIAGVYYCI